jgi:glycosyltransferase involved in cell wall biosynthesis
MPSLPKISVIVPALNAARTLREALDSLTAQGVPYEAILVDGGSRDETVSIAGSVPALRVVSAPGTSIYEALNRGIDESRTSAIVLLNADDTLLPGALATWLDALARAPEAGIVRGLPRLVEIDERGILVPIERSERWAARPLDLELLLRGPCAINSLCIRRDVFKRIGAFDTKYRLASDRDWLLRAWIAGISIREINTPVYRYLSHAGSHTLDRDQRNFAAMRREALAIARYFAFSPTKRPAPDVMRALRCWHAAETALLGMHQLRTRKWREFGSTVSDAFRVTPRWPIDLALDVFSRSAVGV